MADGPVSRPTLPGELPNILPIRYGQDGWPQFYYTDTRRLLAWCGLSPVGYHGLRIVWECRHLTKRRPIH